MSYMYVYVLITCMYVCVHVHTRMYVFKILHVCAREPDTVIATLVEWKDGETRRTQKIFSSLHSSNRKTVRRRTSSFHLTSAPTNALHSSNGQMIFSVSLYVCMYEYIYIYIYIFHMYITYVCVYISSLLHCSNGKRIFSVRLYVRMYEYTYIYIHILYVHYICSVCIFTHIRT